MPFNTSLSHVYVTPAVPLPLNVTPTPSQTLVAVVFAITTGDVPSVAIIKVLVGELHPFSIAST